MLFGVRFVLELYVLSSDGAMSWMLGNGVNTFQLKISVANVSWLGFQDQVVFGLFTATLLAL